MGLRVNENLEYKPSLTLAIFRNENICKSEAGKKETEFNKT